MVARIILFSTIVGMACAATWIGYLPKIPKELAHKEGCYIKEINDVIPFGSEVKPIGSCIRINCSRSMIDYASCGVVDTNDPKCYKTEIDLSKPYPLCCPDIKCEVDNKLD